MPAKRAHLLMVLAMNVICDGATERNELSARHDRREPTMRHHHAQQPVESQTGFRAQDAGGLPAEIDSSASTIEGCFATLVAERGDVNAARRLGRVFLCREC